jgi:hypothetical protein
MPAYTFVLAVSAKSSFVVAAIEAIFIVDQYVHGLRVRNPFVWHVNDIKIVSEESKNMPSDSGDIVNAKTIK